jgi:hypothetical protein
LSVKRSPKNLIARKYNIKMTINTSKTQWQFLEPRLSSWRKQLYLKGRKLTAFTVWSDMIVNEMSPEEIADSKDLPIAAVTEAIEYCENNQKLLNFEAYEERRYLEERGVVLEPI